ncbi:hypothetical protein GCM10027037_21230 [Mucilaginibacter koreensis]
MWSAKAQYFDVEPYRKKSVLHFKIVRNLVVIRLRINQTGPYNFILDTGVGLMVITDPSLFQNLQPQLYRTMKLVGVDGKDLYEAKVIPSLDVDIPGFTAHGVGAAVFTEDHFGLSNYTGMPIHGLLGYEFFTRLAVKIDFSDSTITACDPGRLKKLKKYTVMPITIERNKPYLNVPIHFNDGSTRYCKLIADLGSGQALIFNGMKKRIWPFNQTIPANLGVGLTGIIEGRIGRVDELNLGKYRLKSVLSSIPDTALYSFTETDFDGNIGMNILKKFTVIFDYTNEKVYFKDRSGSFKEPFEHDMTGLEYYAAGDDLKHIIISRVEPGSPAELANLRSGDELTAINFKPVAKMSLEEIDQLFRSRDGRNLLLEVQNQHKYENVIITLKRRI